MRIRCGNENTIFGPWELRSYPIYSMKNRRTLKGHYEPSIRLAAG